MNAFLIFLKIYKHSILVQQFQHSSWLLNVLYDCIKPESLDWRFSKLPRNKADLKFLFNELLYYVLYVTLPDLIGEHSNGRVVDHKRDIERSTEEQKFRRHFDFRAFADFWNWTRILNNRILFYLLTLSMKSILRFKTC